MLAAKQDPESGSRFFDQIMLKQEFLEPGSTKLKRAPGPTNEEAKECNRT